MELEYKYNSIFNKVDIYNNRAQLYESRGMYNEILFTKEEQLLINDLIVEIEQHLFETAYQELLNLHFINEGLFDKAKEAGSKILGKVSGKAKIGIEFCEAIIKKGIKKVSDLIKFFVLLFDKLGDTLKDAIYKLGGFNNSEDENSISEKEFLECVVEYVNAKKDEKQFKLNESGLDVLDKISKKLDDHPLWQSIIMLKYKGKHIRWWNVLLISIVGSLVITFGVNFIFGAIGLSSIAGTAAFVARLIWNGRSILRICLVRRELMIKKGETKYWSIRTIIYVSLTVLPTIALTLPGVKDFINKLVNIGIDKAHEVVGDKFEHLYNELLKIKHNYKEIDPKDVKNTIEQSYVGVPVNDIPKVKPDVDFITKSIEDMHLKGSASYGHNWFEQAMQKVFDANPEKFGEAAHHFTINLDYKGGLDGVIDKYGKEFVSKCYELGLTDDQIRTINLDHASFSVTSGGNKFWGGVYPTDDSGSKFMEALLDICKKHDIPFTYDDLGNVTIDHSVSPDLVSRYSIEYDIPWVAGLNPAYKNLYGKLKICLGSEAAERGDRNTENKLKRLFMKVSKFEEMTFKKAKELAKDLASKTDKKVDPNTTGFNKIEELDKKDNLYNKDVVELFNTNNKSSVDESVDTDEIDENKKQEELRKLAANPENDKCLVFFTTFNDFDKDKKASFKREIPIVLINYKTMYAMDMINVPKLHTRENPYFLKGLFARLTILPLNENDKETKTYLRNLLNDILYKSVISNLKLKLDSIVKASLKDRIFGKKDEEGNTEKIKWELNPKYSKEDNDKNRKEFGNFSNYEILDIANHKDHAYGYLEGVYCEYISKIDDNGNVISTNTNNIPHHIDTDRAKEAEYVRNRFLPVLSCKDTDVYKECLNDENIKHYYMDNDGNWKKIKCKDGSEISILEYMATSIIRSPLSFQKKDRITFKDKLKKFFGNDNDFNDTKAGFAILRLSEIIWKYYKDNSAWKKLVDIVKKMDKWDKSSTFEEAKKWYHEYITPMVKDTSSPIYKDIKADADGLAKYFLRKDGSVREKRVEDKYLIYAIGLKRDDELEEIDANKWKQIEKYILAGDRKGKAAAETRVNRLIDFYNLIYKYWKANQELGPSQSNANESYSYRGKKKYFIFQ